MNEERRLPHHKLYAFGVAMRLLEAVRNARIRDAHLRNQAMRAAKSAALNCAEGAGRVTRADKARAFTIARGEACEAAAAVEIAVAAGEADAGALSRGRSGPRRWPQATGSRQRGRERYERRDALFA